MFLQIFPTTNVKSVTPIKGVQQLIAQPVPASLNVHIKTKDKIKVEFGDCNEAFEAFNNVRW